MVVCRAAWLRGRGGGATSVTKLVLTRLGAVAADITGAPTAGKAGGTGIGEHTCNVYTTDGLVIDGNYTGIELLIIVLK